MNFVVREKVFRIDQNLAEFLSQCPTAGLAFLFYRVVSQPLPLNAVVLLVKMMS